MKVNNNGFSEITIDNGEYYISIKQGFEGTQVVLDKNSVEEFITVLREFSNPNTKLNRIKQILDDSDLFYENKCDAIRYVIDMEC